MKNNNYNPAADQYFIEKYFEATEAIREAAHTPFAVIKSNGTVIPCDTVEEVESIRSEDRSAFPCKISGRLAPADNSRLREEAEAEAAADGVYNEPAEKQEQEQEAPAEAPKAPIKSTTKEGKARIRSYILNLYTEAGYDGQPEEGCQDFPKVARFIWDTFQTEKQYSTPQMWRHGMNYEAVFNDWCRGLPSVLDTCFCYNRSAVKEVQELLCQTDEQVKKYNETMAEDYLIHLIYREVKHAVDYEQEGK